MISSITATYTETTSMPSLRNKAYRQEELLLRYAVRLRVNSTSSTSTMRKSAAESACERVALITLSIVVFAVFMFICALPLLYGSLIVPGENALEQVLDTNADQMQQEISHSLWDNLLSLQNDFSDDLGYRLSDPFGDEIPGMQIEPPSLVQTVEESNNFEIVTTEANPVKLPEPNAIAEPEIKKKTKVKNIECQFCLAQRISSIPLAICFGFVMLITGINVIMSWQKKVAMWTKTHLFHGEIKKFSGSKLRARLRVACAAGTK